MPISSYYSEPETPPWLLAQQQNIAERSGAISKEGYKPKNPYMYNAGEESWVAPWNEDILKSHQLARQTEQWKPYLNQNQEALDQSATPYYENFQKYQDPYKQAVIDNLIEDSNRHFTDKILPAIEARMVGMGQFGSTYHQKLIADAVEQNKRALNSQIAQSRSHGYELGAKIAESDQARALAKAEQARASAGAVQAHNLSDTAVLSTIGEHQRGREQQLRDMQQQNFIKQQRAPIENLKEHAALVQGIPYESSTYYAQQTPGQPQLNTAGQLASVAGQLAGATMAYGPQRKRGGGIKKAMGGTIVPGLNRAVDPNAIQPHMPINSKPKVSPFKKGGIGGHPFTQSSFTKKPKVGGRYKIQGKYK